MKLSTIIAVLLIALSCPASASASALPNPLGDGQETVAEHARHVNRPSAKTVDFGNGAIPDLVRKIILGTPEPVAVDEEHFITQIGIGQIALAMSIGVLGVMLAFVIVRAVREKHRPQISLARLVVVSMVAGSGLLGGLHWRYSEQAFAEAEAECAAALARYAGAKDDKKPDPELVIAAFSAIAASDSAPASQALVDLLRDKGRRDLLFEHVTAPRGIVWPQHLQNFQQSRYLGLALDAAVVRMPKSGEAFLLKDLSRDWGEIEVEQKAMEAYLLSDARIVALGALPNPSKAAFEVLGRLLETKGSEYRHYDAIRALLRIGDARAAALLLADGKAHLAKTGACSCLLDAQHVRNKPAMFGLLVDGYRLHGNTRNAMFFFEAIVDSQWPADLMVDIPETLPSYTTIGTAADQRKIADLISSLLTDPGPRKFTDKEAATLEKVRAEVLSLKLSPDAKALGK